MTEIPVKEQWPVGKPEDRWRDELLDGFWTYEVTGTNGGGVLVIKSGVVVGGNSIMHFSGVVLPIGGGRISMTTQATRFNRHPSWDEVWGTSGEFFSVSFKGRRVGQNFIGTVTRDENGQTWEVILTRRGPA